jgi:hypothetical protein
MLQPAGSIQQRSGSHVKDLCSTCATQVSQLCIKRQLRPVDSSLTVERDSAEVSNEHSKTHRERRQHLHHTTARSSSIARIA